MGKVKLKITPWIARMMDISSADWLTLEKEIGEEATIGDLLVELASAHPEFRNAVFDPDVGIFENQVMIFLNETIQQISVVTDTRLNDGDSVMLLPVYPGG